MFNKRNLLQLKVIYIQALTTNEGIFYTYSKIPPDSLSTVNPTENTENIENIENTESIIERQLMLRKSATSPIPIASEQNQRNTPKVLVHVD